MKTAESEKLRLALYHMSPDRKDLLMRFTGGNEPTLTDVVAVSRFIAALRDTIVSRRRTELRGLGVFVWKPWSNRLPTGARTESWRLIFKFNQRRKYNGDR